MATKNALLLCCSHHTGVEYAWPSVRQHILGALGPSVDVFAFDYERANGGVDLRELYGPNAILLEGAREVQFYPSYYALELGRYYGLKTCFRCSCANSTAYALDAPASQLEAEVCASPALACPCYTMLQQIHGWLASANFIRFYGRSTNTTYQTLVYTRPDVIYTKRLPPRLPRLTVIQSNANALCDTLVGGPYPLVDGALRVLQYLLSGQIVATPSGWLQAGASIVRYGSISGGSLENLLSAAVRLLLKLNTSCRQTRCTDSLVFRRTFPFLKIRPGGHPAQPCPERGLAANASAETRIVCDRVSIGTRG